MEVTLGLLWLLTLWGVWGSGEEPDGEPARAGPAGSAGWGRGEGAGSAGAGVAPLRAPAVRFAKVSDKIRFSCDGVPRPLRWVWVPQFPNCPWAGSGGGPGAGGVPGRRPVLWPPPATSRPPFLHRLRALDPGIRELELTVARGDSGTFYCVGEQRDTESCVRVHVREDLAACLPPEAPAPKAQPGCPRARPPPSRRPPAHLPPSPGPPGPVPPAQLYAPLGAGLLLALAGLGLAWKLRRRSSSAALPSTLGTGLVPGETKSLPPAPEEPILERGDSDLDKGPLYAQLDHAPRWSPRRLSPDTPTIYAVVV